MFSHQVQKAGSRPRKKKKGKKKTLKAKGQEQDTLKQEYGWQQTEARAMLDANHRERPLCFCSVGGLGWFKI